MNVEQRVLIIDSDLKNCKAIKYALTEYGIGAYYTLSVVDSIERLNRHNYELVILDIFSCKAIAYKVSKKNSTQLITSTFKMAWELRSPGPGLIFHSDRGAQYTSHRFLQLLHKHNAMQSFSNSGQPHDNAVAESFFATLKKEEFYRKD